MWFKNLLAYRVPVGWSLTPEELEKKPLIGCGSFDESARGWIAPYANSSLIKQVGQHQLICLGIESKVLPASVVKHEVEERARAIEEDQGYKPGRKQTQELRDNVTAELLAQAFIVRRRTFAWIDTQNGWLVVDASSSAKAEEVLEHLRQTLDQLPLSLLRTAITPTTAMAQWLAEGEAPDGFTIDQSCILQSVTEDHAKVRYDNHSLSGDEIKEHLQSCKMPTRLALTFDERISFVLTEKLEIKRLDFLDIVRDQIGDEEDSGTLFDAEFALMAGEASQLLNALVSALGGEVEQ